MIQFTAKEMNLMCIFPTTTKQALMQALLYAHCWMDPELTAISDTALYKISQLSEEEFLSIRFEPVNEIEDG